MYIIKTESGLHRMTPRTRYNKINHVTWIIKAILGLVKPIGIRNEVLLFNKGII